MQIVPSTLIVVLIALVVMIRGRDSSLMALFALLPMGMMAFVNLPAVGGTSILAMDIGVLMVATSALMRQSFPDDLGRLIGTRGPSLFLLAFLLYALIATLFFPRVFAGATEVFSIARSTKPAILIQPLGPSTGNLSQLLRIILSLMAFAAVALWMLRRPNPRLALRAMILVTVIHVGMGFLDLLTQATHTTGLLSPVRTANYALTLGHNLAGLNRMMGGYPEASSYGYLSLGLLGFWVSFWLNDRSGRRLPAVLAALTLFVVLRSTSSSAYVGLALLVLAYTGTRIARAQNLALDLRLARLVVPLVAMLPFALIGAVAMYQLVPSFAGLLDRLLLDKLASQSGVERMSWNIQALRNFIDTGLLGAGLGSVRASNWLAAVLGTTGIPGLVLLCGFLWRFFRMPAPTDPEARLVVNALRLGCAGFLARALVVKASPNLDISFFAMAGLAIGLVIGLETVPRKNRRRSAVPAFQQTGGPA